MRSIYGALAMMLGGAAAAASVPLPPLEGRRRRRVSGPFRSERHSKRRERDAAWRADIKANGWPAVKLEYMHSSARRMAEVMQ